MTGTATEPPPEHQRPSGSQAAPPAHVAADIATNGSRGTSPPEPVRSRRGTGTLDIRAKTWADCFLSDGGAEVSIGTAPTTVTDLTVGRHRVRCKNEGQHKDETVTVTIDATKTAVIEKNW